MSETQNKKKKLQEQKQQAEKNEMQMRAAFQTVLDTPAGKNVMIYILEKTKVMNQVFVPGDTERMLVNEGRRIVGLWLLQQLADARPDLFIMPVMRKPINKGD